MAVLQSMREKFGIAISVIIALSLLYFIAPMDDLMTLFGRPQNVGEIAGKEISYEDFQADVDRYTTINEIITGSSVQNEQTQQQIRNAAWQELIDKYVFIENAKAAGLNVGKDELQDLLTGENISPVVSRNPMFLDNAGNFSAEAVIDFVQNIGNDTTGQLRAYWDYIQNTVYTQQFYAKYGALFVASAYENALQKDSDVAMNNTKANVDYVLAPYSFAIDTTVTVKNSAIKSYYKAHKANYKQNASRDIEYVVFEVVPSADDINATADAMQKAHEEFAAAENIKTFLLKNSERQLSDYWYKAGELKTVNADIDAFVFGKAQGVSPIAHSGNSYYAAKVVETANVSDSVYVKHILLAGANAKHDADSLVGVVKRGAKFSDLVALHSLDQNSVADGELGNLGWFTQNYMIPGFESCITAELNKPFVLNTRYGTHVVVVTKKTRPVLKKRVAILEKTAIASKETFQEYYSKANKFAALAAGSAEGYKKAVDSLGVYSHRLNVTEGTSNYGAIDNAKEVTRKVFETKKGKATEIITVNQNFFFIACVNKINKEGYTPVEEVSESIRQILYTEARNANKKAEVAAKIEGLTSISEVADALGASVVSGKEVSFSMMGAQAIDPAALGVMYSAPIAEIAGPVAGAAGIYVVKVNSRETESFYTAEDAEQMASQKAQYSSQLILPVMSEAAGVKDNRARYY